MTVALNPLHLRFARSSTPAQPLQVVPEPTAPAAPAANGRGLSRVRIVHTAIEALESGGEADMGINRLARRLGCKPPSLYNHVHGAADLRAAVAIEGWRRCYRETEAAIAGLPSSELLKGLAQATRGFACRHPELYRLMASTPLVESDEEYGPVAALGSDLWAHAVKPMGYEGKEAIHALRAIRSAAASS